MSGEGYQLTRQPGRTEAIYNDNFPAVSTGSQDSNRIIDTTAEAPTRPESGAINKKTKTMDIPLEDVQLAQLFLRADGSVKGISFTYEDTDLADLGCCEAELGGWYAFFRPRHLLFTPAPGYHVGDGLFPVESISFAQVLDGPEGETMAIRMQGSLVLRLSPGGLEMDVGRQVERPAARPVEVPGAEHLEVVVAQPINTTPETELRAADTDGTAVRCRKGGFEQVRKTLKRWFGMKSALARLSTRVRKVDRKQNQ